MATKRKYFETVHTKKHGVVLVKGDFANIVEVWCEAYLSSNKRIKQKAFNGFYYISELTPHEATTQP